MTYRDAAARLGIEGVCFDPACGLNAYRHRGSIDPFGVIHFRERRMTRRGLRLFLLLAARRDRLGDAEYLNDERRFGWWYRYVEEMTANAWAATLGVRFPVAFSRAVRLRSWIGLPRRVDPAIGAWARRGLA